MRDALSLTDQAIAFGSGQLQEATVRQMLGSVDRSYVFRLIEALANGDGKTVVETSEALRLNGLSAASTLEEMSTVLQRMAVVQATGGRAGDDDSDPEAQDTARLAALMPVDETQLLYSICLHGRADLGLAPDEYAALTMVLLRLLAFKPQGVQPTAEKKTLNRPAAPAPTPVAPVPVSAPAPATAQRPSPSKPPAIQPWDDEPVAPYVPGAWAAERSAQVKEEPAKRAEPTDIREQSALPPRLLAPAFQAPPPGQVLPVRESARPSQHSDADDDGRSDVPDDYEPNWPAAPAEHEPIATKIVAIPVRTQTESRADVAAQQAPHALLPTEEGDFWHATVQQLIKAEAINAMVRELALQSQLIARDTDQWILRVERESLNQPGTRDRLGNALKLAGHDVKLVVEIGRVDDCPARRNTAASQEKQLAAEKIIFDDPFVQSMMRDFGAKIVPGSIKPL
jgi:DNA polymerase-3 subunit gamma/tau